MVGCGQVPEIGCAAASAAAGAAYVTAQSRTIAPRRVPFSQADLPGSIRDTRAENAAIPYDLPHFQRVARPLLRHDAKATGGLCPQMSTLSRTGCDAAHAPAGRDSVAADRQGAGACGTVHFTKELLRKRGINQVIQGGYT